MKAFRSGQIRSDKMKSSSHSLTTWPFCCLEGETTAARAPYASCASGTVQFMALAGFLDLSSGHLHLLPTTSRLQPCLCPTFLAKVRLSLFCHDLSNHVHLDPEAPAPDPAPCGAHVLPSTPAAKGQVTLACRTLWLARPTRPSSLSAARRRRLGPEAQPAPRKPGADTPVRPVAAPGPPRTPWSAGLSSAP